MSTEKILKLNGKSAEYFLEYDSKKLPKKEIDRNKRAHQIYLQYCKP